MPALYSHMKQKPDLLKLDYLYGGELVYQPEEALDKRILTDFECVYIISGTATYIADGIHYIAPPGSIIFSIPGSEERYQWDSVQPTRHAYFHFSTDSLPTDWPAPKHWKRLHEKPPPLAISLFRHILQHIYEHNNWPAEAPDHRDCMLVEMLIDACIVSPKKEIKSFEQSRPEPVRLALKWMRQQIDEDPCNLFSLDDIARAANCSPKHLCRVFSQSVGHSPAHTGTLMRLQLAIVLLSRTNLTVKEIALRCGFENPFYFSRRFSKILGSSPTAIRNDIAKGVPPPSNPLPVDITPRVQW